MAAEKNFLGLIDAGREIRRPPLVGMEFLHQSAVRAEISSSLAPGFTPRI